MTSIDATLVETLLNMAESDVLDFKRDQYPLAGASDEQKAEIVKDIIAFANAWKTADAHIVIGASENPGGRAVVVGVGGHLDDASLQQLVNSKTNRPVSFEYLAFTFENKPLGIIRIKAEQQRPVYLKSACGKLRPNVVYIRRGSSTAEASPDEIARMGAAAVSSAQEPQIVLELANVVARRRLGPVIEVASKVLRERQPEPEMEAVRVVRDARRRVGAHSWTPADPEAVALHRAEVALLCPVGLWARNAGRFLVADVRVVVEVPKLDELRVVDQVPPRPGTVALGPLRRAVQTRVNDASDHWEVVAWLDKLQPGATVWSAPFWIGAPVAQDLSLVGRIFGDNVSTPIDVPLAITIAVEEGWLDDGEDEREGED